MFVLFDGDLYISGKFTSGKGKRQQITPEFTNDIEEAHKFNDEIDVYEFFESETRGNQILKSYTRKEIENV